MPIDSFSKRASTPLQEICATYNELGLGLMKLGKVEQAIISHKKALAKCPQEASSYYYLARAFHLLEKREHASFCYERALELDPFHPLALDI